MTMPHVHETQDVIRIPPRFFRSGPEFDGWLRIEIDRQRQMDAARAEQARWDRQAALELPETYHAGLADDDDEGPSVAVVWAVVAAGLTLVGLGVWLL